MWTGVTDNVITLNHSSVTVNKAISLKPDLYHKSTDGKDKLWYATNATTCYRGHGNASVFTINHEWRNHDDHRMMLKKCH
jgi:hypothetical protein